jgi:hypothetical protein
LSHSAPLEVGAVVEADYRSTGEYCGGHIVAVSGDSATYVVEYDNGEREAGVPRTHIHAVEFEEGLEVETNYMDSHEGSREVDHFRAGKVIGGNAQQGTVDIEYENGEKELGVPRQRVRVGYSKALQQPSSDEDSNNSSPAARPPETVKLSPTKDKSKSKLALAPGSSVEAIYHRSGSYASGKIAAVLENGFYDIEYDDGKKETRVPKYRIRAKARYVLFVVEFYDTGCD